jgi:hypothetical protein
MVEKLWEAARTFNEERTHLEQLAGMHPPRTLIVSPERMPPAGFIHKGQQLDQ